MKLELSAIDDVDLIDVAALKSMLPSGNCRVIDTRFDLFDAQKGPADYLAGHIPGASFAHMDDDLASAISPTSGRHPLPDVDEFIDKLVDDLINEKTTIPT